VRSESLVSEPVVGVLLRVFVLELGRESVGEGVDHLVVLAGARRVVREVVQIGNQPRLAVRSGPVLAVCLRLTVRFDGVDQLEPDGLDGVLADGVAERRSVIVLDRVGGRFDGRDQFVVSDPLGIGDCIDDRLGERSRRVVTLVRGRVLDRGAEVDGFVARRRPPAHLAAVVAIPGTRR